MAHGLPDESHVKSGIPLYLTTDLGELAVRVGSPVIYHRQGAVLYMETFDKGYRRCAVAVTGGEGDYDITSDYWETGGVSFRMATTLGEVATVGVLKRIPFLYLGSYAAHSLLSYPSSCYRITLTYSYYDGTNQNLFEIRITPALGKAEYLDNEGEYQEITTALSFLDYARIFNYHRLKVELETLTYVSFTVNQVEYPLAGISGDTLVNDVQSHLEIGIETEGNADYRGIVYVDSIIVTQEET